MTRQMSNLPSKVAKLLANRRFGTRLRWSGHVERLRGDPLQLSCMRSAPVV